MHVVKVCFILGVLQFWLQDEGDENEDMYVCAHTSKLMVISTQLQWQLQEDEEKEEVEKKRKKKEPFFTNAIAAFCA